MNPSNGSARPGRTIARLAVVIFLGASACGGQVASGADGSPDAGGACALSASMPRPDSGCASGSITFQLAGARGSQWWIEQTQATASSNENWLTLFCPTGAQLALWPTEATTSRDCASCPTSWSLSSAFSAWRLPAGDQAQTWDGTLYAPSRCGASSMACVSARCAPPGRYVARMCACDAANQTPNACQKPTCVDVPFNYPRDGLVIGLLPNP